MFLIVSLARKLYSRNPDDGDLESGCKKALEQIEEKGYAERLLRDGMKNIVRYGIACYKRTCKVTVLS